MADAYCRRVLPKEKAAWLTSWVLTLHHGAIAGRQLEFMRKIVSFSPFYLDNMSSFRVQGGILLV